MDTVQLIAISDDLDVCNLVYTSLASQGHQAICVPSSRDALQLLSRGVKTEFVLLDVGKDQTDERLFDPALLQMIRSDQLCILSSRGDRNWQSFAAEWKISTVFTKPLMHHDFEKLLHRQEAIASSDPTVN